jgi:hypothetical protein
MSKQCQSCRTQNHDEARFCNQCGAPFKTSISCPNCHAQNDAEAQFCNRCGTSLTSALPSGVLSDAMGWTAPAVSAVPSSGSSPLWEQSGAGWQPTANAEPTVLDLPPSQAQVSKKKRAASRKSKPKVNSTNSQMRGEVRGFKERMERKNQNATNSSDDTVWTFRLERYQNGNRLPPIPVELRGQVFTGFINEGDTVELLDRWRGEGLHRTTQVYNVTNDVMVKAKKRGFSIWLKLWILFLVFSFSAFAFFVVTGGNF